MVKKLKNTVRLLALIFILNSCDPGHSLLFINNSDSNLSVKLKLDTTVVNHSLHFWKDKKTDFVLFNVKQSDTIALDFGMGTWSDSEIKKQANSIIKIEIENDDFKSVYKSKRKIVAFLKDNIEKRIIVWETEIAINIE